jgi:hypothetical protein
LHLLDAKSREDAEQQIAEMLFLRSGAETDSSTEKESRNAATRGSGEPKLKT